MYKIGVDLGGTKIAAALVDGENRIVAKATLPTLPERGNDAVAEDIAALVKTVAEEKGAKLSDIELVGIATPGAINCDTGYIERACNLYMEHYPMVDKLRSILGDVRIALENDANAAALGEYVAGAAKGARYSVMITLGTGVGGGFVAEGKVYSGFNFAGGEFGHMVIDFDGEPCNCGRRGCWEAYSSATALIEKTRRMLEEYPDSKMHEVVKEAGKISGKTAFIAARMGDEAGRKTVDWYIAHLACGIVNVINLFQPDILCIGGGVSNEGKGLIDPLLEKIAEESFTKASDKQTEIRIAALGNEAGIIGAANL